MEKEQEKRGSVSLSIYAESDIHTLSNAT